MKKRLLAGLLAFVMVFGVAPFNFIEFVSADNSGICGITTEVKLSESGNTFPGATATLYSS